MDLCPHFYEQTSANPTDGVETLILRELQRGSFSVAREWTDWADPSLHNSVDFPPQRFDAHLLLDLVAFLDQLAISSNQKRIDA